MGFLTPDSSRPGSLITRPGHENRRSSKNQKPDAQVSRKQRDQEPIAEVGNKVALTPPRRARIAREKEGQKGESRSQRDRYRYDLDESDPDTVNDREAFLEHAFRLPGMNATPHLGIERDG